jgi:hypothetical protein
MAKTMMAFVAVPTVIALAFFGWKLTSRSAYESAEYTAVETDGPFEIRDYPDLILASTSMQSDSQGNDGSFMRLFGYISGANDTSQKVSMTTPVFMEKGSDASHGQMGFVIPKEVAEQRVPEPSHQEVSIQRRRGGRFAVMRFAGRLDRRAVETASEKLRQWLSARGLEGQADLEYAGYDPPWTPGMLRRNEVLIRLSDGN